MNRLELFEIVYALAAKDGREAALFGNCIPAAREAFSRSLAGEEFPELWFEVPLAGDPWFDFHSLTSHEDVAGTQAAFAGHGGVYANALAWFAGQEADKVRQLALSYDTREGDVDNPAVQLLVSKADESVSRSFLEAAGRPELCGAYGTFTRRMAPEWYACYVGVFPGRDTAADPWVRVECIVGGKLQRAYANDAPTLRGHLADIGLESIGEDAIAGIQELARSPFPLEFQFNVGLAGMALPTVSASVRFQPDDWTDRARRGAIGRLADWMRERNLADDRCLLLAETVFAKRAARAGESATLSCFPAFVKLRWREGLPLDAKAYLMVQVR